jgi:hypothetical protein
MILQNMRQVDVYVNDRKAGVLTEMHPGQVIVSGMIRTILRLMPHPYP